MLFKYKNFGENSQMKLKKLKYAVIIKSTKRTFLYLNNKDYFVHWKEFSHNPQFYGFSVPHDAQDYNFKNWKNITKILKNF